MSIAGWELDSFALLRLMDYMQMIHSLLLLFDPSTPAVWKSTRDIFGWRWFFYYYYCTNSCTYYMHTDIYTHTNASQQSRDGIVQSDMLKTTLPKDRLFFFFWMNLFAKLHGFKKNLLLGEYQRESCQGQLLQFNLTSSGRRKWTNLLFFFSKCQFSHPKSFARQRAS